MSWFRETKPSYGRPRQSPLLSERLVDSVAAQDRRTAIAKLQSAADK
jgi:hypothetical protein